MAADATQPLAPVGVEVHAPDTYVFPVIASEPIFEQLAADGLVISGRVQLRPHECSGGVLANTLQFEEIALPRYKGSVVQHGPSAWSWRLRTLGGDLIASSAETYGSMAAAAEALAERFAPLLTNGLHGVEVDRV